MYARLPSVHRGLSFSERLRTPRGEKVIGLSYKVEALGRRSILSCRTKQLALNVERALIATRFECLFSQKRHAACLSDGAGDVGSRQSL